MAWYYGTFSCGHEGRVDVVGPTKDRQWKIDRKFEGLCEECNKVKLAKEREEENAKAAEKAAEYELPVLEGTPKQVAWANTIRINLIDSISFSTINRTFKEWAMEKPNEEKQEIKELVVPFKDELLSYLKESIMNEKTAAFFINNRYSFDRFYEKVFDSFLLSKKTPTFLEEPEEVKEETTVQPENFNGTTVEIIKSDDTMIAKCEKNEDAIKIFKSLGMKWENGRWERKLYSHCGKYVDRAAELGNKLLINGFRIMCQDENVRKMAVDATYQPECKNWINWNDEFNKLSIRQYEKDDSIYNVAKQVKGAKWNRESGSLLIDIENASDVLEFAADMKFKVSQLAFKKIMEYKSQLAKETKVTPKQKEKMERIDDILKTSVGILEDLKDD